MTKDMLSLLPDDVQQNILQKLNILEFSRFRTVCKTWRSIASAARQNPCFYPLQIPWLIQEAEPGHKLPKLSQQKMFFELEIYKHREFSGICGASQGWLVVRKHCVERRCLLINPLTGRRISLPSTRPSISMAVLLPPHGNAAAPFDADNGLVVAYRAGVFCYCRSQDQRWTELFTDPFWMKDMIYHKGNIYAVNLLLTVLVINFDYVTTSCTTWELPRPVNVSFEIGSTPTRANLVECHGDLLMVVRSSEQCYYYPQVTTVYVFKLDPNSRYWDKVENLGDHAIFVGRASSIAVSTSCCFSGIEANCIYFIDEDYRDQGVKLSIWVFDLGNRRVRSCSFGIRCSGRLASVTWFMPSLP